jgi:SAM-dependent methyltransferase
MFLSQFVALMEDENIEPGKLLCIGARYGEEVKAWKRLGFQAIGVDLNPGENNSHVIKGDFHNLRWADEYFNYTWSNAMDHALYLDKMIKEAHRVLKTGGKSIFECKQHVISSVVQERYWEAVFWENQEEIVEYFKNLDIWESVKYSPLRFFIQRGDHLSLLERPCIILEK